MSSHTTRIFSIVAEGDVIATISVPSTSPHYEMLWAGLSSSPIIVESTDTPAVSIGWTYDGVSFLNKSS